MGTAIIITIIVIGLGWFYDQYKNSGKSRHTQKINIGGMQITERRDSDGEMESIIYTDDPELQAEFKFGMEVGINAAVTSKLFRAGYKTIDDLLKADPAALFEIKGVGPKTLEAIEYYKRTGQPYRGAPADNGPVGIDKRLRARATKTFPDLDPSRPGIIKVWLIDSMSQSNPGEIYTARCIHYEDQGKQYVSLECNCPAADRHEIICKHERAIVDGFHFMAVSSNDKQKVAEVHILFKKTDYKNIYRRFEKQIQRIKEDSSSSEKDKTRQRTIAKDIIGRELAKGLEIVK